MDTSQTIQTKIKIMTQKENFTKYEENNHPKEKRKKQHQTIGKRFLSKKRYVLHLNIWKMRDRVGLWMCAWVCREG